MQPIYLKMRSISRVFVKRVLPVFLLLLYVLPALAETDTGSDSPPAGFPAWLSILPPLIAIGGALLFREVISALVLGIFSGLVILVSSSGKPLWTSVTGIADTIRVSATDSGHMSIILFSLFIGGMVQLITKNGGMMAIVKRISKWARDARSGQLASYFLGIFIFFDDYANTMVVGNTMRPVTDKLKISREKLAYIVDSTAAPIAATAFVTTWIGAELEYIQRGVDQIGELKGMGLNAYGLFMDSLKYSFYPFLTLLFMFFLIIRRKDFGPMLRYESVARSRMADNDEEKAEAGEVDDVATERERSFNALIPIFLLVAGTITGLIYTGTMNTKADLSGGWMKYLSEVIGAADSYSALLWASFGTLIITVLLTISQRIMTVHKAMDTLFDGFKQMLPAIGILVLAWGLGAVTEQLGTANFVSGVISGSVSPFLIPSITFILAALIAFSTGTSWGTMAILYPVVLYTSWQVGSDSGLEMGQNLVLLTNSISCVLAGSVLGDHCSPISDTTILSSLSTQCNHIQHVKSQMPYALTVGAVSVLLGTTLVSYGVPWYVCFALSALVLYGIVSYFGKMPEEVKYKEDQSVLL